MKVNGTGLVALVGVGLLAAGVGLAWGWAATLMVVGSLLLVSAAVDVLLGMRGQ
jgi:hypothetical protein